MSSLAALLLCLFRASLARAAVPIPVSGTSPIQPIALSAYISLSIELSSFPSFAGNLSNPNEFSVNLLRNLGSFQEYMPTIRVGGNTQDRAIYDPALKSPTARSCSADPKAIQCIGPSFFHSYRTFPDTFYSHGFNLAANNVSGYQTLKQTVRLACKAIGSRINVWELGNESNLFSQWRPSGWTVSDYVGEWLNGTSHIATYLQEACPELGPPSFMAPSFSTVNSAFSPVTAFQDGLNSNQTITQISVHNYISGATKPGVTLQGTLMNHSVTVRSLTKHVNAANALASIDPAAYILGECNSLYGGGASGLSNVFGAALWVLDFTLHAASTGVIHRLHFHQAANAAYGAWSPISSVSGPPATHPPYYGKLAAARFLGASNTTTVVEIPLSSTPHESAYAAYKGGDLARFAILNMKEYNVSSTVKRPVATYNFALSGDMVESKWKVERLTAPGSDVTSNVTFGGYAYEYSTLGKGVKVNSTAAKETVQTGKDGVLTIGVSNSEAVVLTLVK